MPTSPAPRRTARPVLLGRLVLLGALVLGLGGCGEEAPVDDGSYSSLQAGAPAVLEGLGATVISLDQPASADPNLVDGVLATQGLEAQAYAVRAVDGLALDPEKVAGLLGMAGNVESRSTRGDGRFLVLCFDRVEAAIVFAESDPEIFADAALERARSTFFSGNLVSFSAPVGDDDATERFRAALDALAGTGASAGGAGGSGTEQPGTDQPTTDEPSADEPSN